MGQVEHAEVVIVHDLLAMPGLRWWARFETATLGQQPTVLVTALHASLVDALDELATISRVWFDTSDD